MDWKVVLVIIIAVAVVGGLVTLGALLSREKGKRKRVEAEKDQREGEVRRLMNERKISKKTDKEVADELTGILNNWSPTDPGSGIGGGTGPG